MAYPLRGGIKPAPYCAVYSEKVEKSSRLLGSFSLASKEPFASSDLFFDFRVKIESLRAKGETSMKRQELKFEILRKFGKVCEAARAIGIRENTLSRVLTERSNTLPRSAYYKLKEALNDESGLKLNGIEPRD